MATTFTNRREAQAYLERILKTKPLLSQNVDIDLLTDDLHQVVGGSWDFEHIDHDLFWATVKKHNEA